MHNLPNAFVEANIDLTTLKIHWNISQPTADLVASGIRIDSIDIRYDGSAHVIQPFPFLKTISIFLPFISVPQCRNADESDIDMGWPVQEHN